MGFLCRITAGKSKEVADLTLYSLAFAQPNETQSM